MTSVHTSILNMTNNLPAPPVPLSHFLGRLGRKVLYREDAGFYVALATTGDYIIDKSLDDWQRREALAQCIVTGNDTESKAYQKEDLETYKLRAASLLIPDWMLEFCIDYMGEYKPERLAHLFEAPAELVSIRMASIGYF